MPLSGYSGTPLVKKLGIKSGSTLALLAAPEGFVDELIGLPSDVRVITRTAGTPQLVVWFVRSKRELEGRIPAIERQMGEGLWIAWPKKASGVATDVTEDTVRAAGLKHGLVDYKVCAVNETWSGLKFARRKKGSGQNKT